MDQFDNMKAMWAELNSRVESLEAENRNLARKIIKDKYKSAREKLIKKYYAFISIEIIMIIFMSNFFIFNPEINEKYRIISLIYWDLFFIIEIIIDGFLLYNIKKIDIYTSTIKDISRDAANNWKLHKIAIFTGLPLAFGAIILFALSLNANIFTIYGMIVGCVIGAIIGIYQLSKFKNYYTQLVSND